MASSNGYSGKILKVDLTTGKFETIPTEKYAAWGGGHGMGSAIFFDLCEDKTVKGTDPKNVVTIMTSPLSGTLAPSVSGRTEVQAIGIQAYPIGWYTRSNFGGRFSTQLKFAGWDGIVLTGKSPKKVWINIVNGDVKLQSADDLWGLNTRETQEEIWASVEPSKKDSDWVNLGQSRDAGRTTQRPAVLTIGPNAEKFGPMASLIHDAGNGAGQGGFGGVFASKNLKAISVLGTSGVDIADPNALMEARLWANGYSFGGHHDDPVKYVGLSAFSCTPGRPLSTIQDNPAGTKSRPQGCVSCIRNCRGRTDTGRGNESQCVDFFWYDHHDVNAHGYVTDATPRAADAIQLAGVNAFAVEAATLWLERLHTQGILGKGKQIDSNLPFESFGSAEWAEAFINAIVTQTDIGKELCKGVAQAAQAWGRLEMDTKSGILPLQEYGLPHHYDARTEVEWGYGSLIGERDINEHDFNWHVYWTPTINGLFGLEPPVSAKRLSEIIAKKTPPFNDPMMVNYSDEGIYSESMAKTLAWHRHYTRFYKQSMLFCDWAWADFVNPYGPDHEGMTGEGENRFMNAVTGKEMTFEEGIEVGRRIWNLDRAIWALQGRHRDVEKFAAYIYETGAAPGTTTYEAPYTMPVFENNEWAYKSVAGRKLDAAKFEQFKTLYYTLEGWDPASGWATRETLEKLDLANVADALEKAGKLGASA
jgi:aldehyde:ferredoxin oxidoreductase